MTLYVVEVEKDKLITHDGNSQLGMFNMSLTKFFSLVKSEYLETYWLPDTFSDRYKRSNYQKHLKSASIGTKHD